MAAKEFEIDSARRIMGRDVSPLAVEIMGMLRSHSGMMDQDARQRHPMSPADRYRADYCAAEAVIARVMERESQFFLIVDYMAHIIAHTGVSHTGTEHLLPDSIVQKAILRGLARELGCPQIAEFDKETEK